MYYVLLESLIVADYQIFMDQIFAVSVGDHKIYENYIPRKFSHVWNPISVHCKKFPLHSAVVANILFC